MSLIDIFSYSFIERAYLAGGAIAMLCAVLGIFLVLRKFSMIGDGLSHVSFGAIALGLFLGIYPFYVAIPVVLLASFFIVKLSQKARVFGDAAIGIVSAVGIAVGVMLASLSKGFSVDLFSYLFGNILAISRTEEILAILLSIIGLAVIFFNYRRLACATFDESYAKSSGIKTDRLNFLTSALTALTVVLGVKVAGVMLVSALLVIPAAAALQLAKSFFQSIYLAAIIGIFSVLSGITLAFLFDFPAGATVVMVNFVVFLLSLAWRKLA
jgi:zinc transport system permease protein